VIALDSSAIIALFLRRDQDHAHAVEVVQSDTGPLIVPAGILSEVAYMLEIRAGGRALDSFLENIADGSLLLDCGEKDFLRIRELVDRYRSLPLGFADASVIACAERRGRRVLSYDQRDFSVVSREGTFTLVTWS
jgi:predicted nucleic acid-binding protein